MKSGNEAFTLAVLSNTDCSTPDELDSVIIFTELNEFDSHHVGFPCLHNEVPASRFNLGVDRA